MHEHHGDQAAKDTETDEGRKFEERLNAVFGDDEGREITEKSPRNGSAGDAGNNRRCKGADGVMADHHFIGEQGPGDRRIERGGHRRRHAAAQERPRHGSGQMQSLGQPTAERRPQMHGRAFAAHRSSGANRHGVNHGSAQTIGQ